VPNKATMAIVLFDCIFDTPTAYQTPLFCSSYPRIQ
jgi:hypothetical protein